MYLASYKLRVWLHQKKKNALNLDKHKVYRAESKNVMGSSNVGWACRESNVGNNIEQKNRAHCKIRNKVLLLCSISAVFLNIHKISSIFACLAAS